MKRLISALLVVSISANISKPVKANPAVLAPGAFCAGTAGVGCVLMGTAIIGGIVVYIWKTNNGKLFRANISGQVLQSDFGDQLPDSDSHPEKESDTVTARNADEALRKCQNVAKLWGGVLKPGKPKSVGKGIFLCNAFPTDKPGGF
jgi:hypothetical protein